ncbi:adhesion G protein-coupled receptor E3-like [Patiria miniata]|uniref:Adhesion G-protein coupled receptor D1-like n=1 Tax=Patiria miniata TaxID=46514 RepID=A0A913ZTN3_PATMI|nr:adhesion G protein-coupled receptor E3-like [Patiria miniata]
MDWYWMPLNGTSDSSVYVVDSNYVYQTSHIGGTSPLDIVNFQSEDLGIYLCVINWWSAVANVTLGPERVATTIEPTTSSATTQADDASTTATTQADDASTTATTQADDASTTATTQADDASTTEVPFTTESFATVTPTWCALGDVDTLQEAIACGETTRIDVEPGNLTDAKREELVDFLKFIATQPAEQLTTISDTVAVTKTVLMAFAKLTDPDQSLSVQGETAIVADTEEALKMLAGTLAPKTCATIGHQTGSASLCNSLNIDQSDGYTFKHQVPLSYDADGNAIGTFEESLEFDLLDLDKDAKNASVIVLRKESTAQNIDRVKDLDQDGNLQASNETQIQLNSALLTFSVFVEGDRTSVPVTFSLYHLENANDESMKGESSTVNISRQSLCVFVDETDDQDVQWSSWGCKVLLDRSTSKYTYCTCNHSTSFAVLMQVTPFKISTADSLALTWITYIGCGTSMIMLVLMLAVFLYLGRMLQSGRSFIHTNLAIAILLAQILFIAGIDRTENRGVCKAVALLLHFCYLSVFAWMLVEGVHLYMKIVKVYGSENIKMYPYLFIGWGIPVIITLISFGASNDGYGTGNSCWLDTSSGLIWAFVAPALLVIVINMIVLAMVVRIIIKSAHLRQEKKYDHIKAGIKGALMLLPILGLTWVFGLLAVNSALTVFQYLFTIFNSFQGLFIFLINCAFNSEVKAAFVRKREKQRMAKDRETLEHSMSFVYTTKLDTNAENTSDTGGRSDHNPKEPYTDITSLRSVSLSSRPGSSSSLLDVTQRKHLKRPHSGKVSPMPNTEDLETI